MVLSMDLHHCQCFIEKPGAADEPPKQFTFDGTYFIDQTTEQMYNEMAYPLVEVSTRKPFWSSFSFNANTEQLYGDIGITEVACLSLDTLRPT